MKPCTTCKFYIRGMYDSDFCTRRHTAVEVPDPVRGGKKVIDTTPMESRYLYAELERVSILPWKCGMKARFHQPKVPA